MPHHTPGAEMKGTIAVRVKPEAVGEQPVSRIEHEGVEDPE